MNSRTTTPAAGLSGGVRYSDHQRSAHAGAGPRPQSYTAADEDGRPLGGRRDEHVSASDHSAGCPVRLDEVHQPRRASSTAGQLVERGTPIVKYYVFPTTGATTPGLGYAVHLEHLLSAGRRQLEADRRRQDGAARHDRTVLPGRLFNNDFLNGTPGLPTDDGARRRHRSVHRGLPDGRLVVNPTANIDLAGHETAPYRTASHLASIARSARNMGVSVSVAYKRWHDQWAGPTPAPPMERRSDRTTGPLTVFPLHNAARRVKSIC